eukprot:1195257-Prorocentrum_minimum.AAC.3
MPCTINSLESRDDGRTGDTVAEMGQEILSQRCGNRKVAANGAGQGRRTQRLLEARALHGPPTLRSHPATTPLNVVPGRAIASNDIVPCEQWPRASESCAFEAWNFRPMNVREFKERFQTSITQPIVSQLLEQFRTNPEVEMPGNLRASILGLIEEVAVYRQCQYGTVYAQKARWHCTTSLACRVLPSER